MDFKRQKANRLIWFSWKKLWATGNLRSGSAINKQSEPALPPSVPQHCVDIPPPEKKMAFSPFMGAPQRSITHFVSTAYTFNQWPIWYTRNYHQAWLWSCLALHKAWQDWISQVPVRVGTGEIGIGSCFSLWFKRQRCEGQQGPKSWWGCEVGVPETQPSGSQALVAWKAGAITGAVAAGHRASWLNSAG